MEGGDMDDAAAADDAADEDSAAAATAAAAVAVASRGGDGGPSGKYFTEGASDAGSPKKKKKKPKKRKKLKETEVATLQLGKHDKFPFCPTPENIIRVSELSASEHYNYLKLSRRNTYQHTGTDSSTNNQPPLDEVSQRLSVALYACHTHSQ
jgi:hypothetical protein